MVRRVVVVLAIIGVLVLALLELKGLAMVQAWLPSSPAGTDIQTTPLIIELPSGRELDQPDVPAATRITR